MKVLRLLIILFLISSSTYTFCQSKVSLLDRHLKNYDFNFKRLISSRGAEPYEESTIENLKKNIKLYSGRDTNMSYLFYHFDKDTLHIWCFSQFRIEAYEFIKITLNELTEMEVNLKESLRFSSLTQRGAKMTNKSLTLNSDGYISKTSEVLFPKSVADVLINKKYLLILPSVNIGSFPFYILKPWNDTTAMIDRLTIAVLPSFSDLLRFNDINQPLFKAYKYRDSLVFTPEREPLVVGDPTFGKVCKNDLDKLPGAKKEASVIATKLNTELITNKDANPQHILNIMEQTDLLYFACHGIADTLDPLNESYLLLSDEADKCGKLTARMIQKSRLLPNTIVFLSACRTGSGKTHSGGIIGVSRAFIIAGASSVIMSLWDVGDKATGEMMPVVMDSMFVYSPFFPATNIRNAILEYRKTNPNPRDWGAFSYFGIPFPVNVPARLNLSK